MVLGVDPLAESVLLKRARISAIIADNREHGPPATQETVEGVPVLVMIPAVAGALVVIIPAVKREPLEMILVEGAVLVMMPVPSILLALVMMPRVAGVVVIIPAVDGVLRLLVMTAALVVDGITVLLVIMPAVVTLLLVVATTCTAPVDTSFQIT